MIPDFQSFQKISRLSRNCTVTEKIDGTNAVIQILEDGVTMLVGSRSRWITPQDDNFGFARWAREHEEELVKGLGIGRHYGEWWGQGIQRKYGLTEKRFSLFNTHLWTDDAVRPKCCHVVPVLYQGLFDSYQIEVSLVRLDSFGSLASPGFMKPEGVVIYHEAAKTYFKKTIEGDEKPKGSQE